jgi:Reverse transcriptase (RNA-dependent DNA polymerase)
VPTTFEEAFFGPKSNVWRPEIYIELMSFTSRKAFKKRDKKQVIEQLRRKLMTTKWIFKEKINAGGTIKCKARCVSRGFTQIPGVDYTESFAPVASDSGIGIVIGIFLYYFHMFPRDEWVLESFDVEVAFLNALLKNPVYIEWPKGIKELGFYCKEESDNTCAELIRAMYGNIDTPLQWMKTFTRIPKGEGMNLKQSATDPCIFYKQRGGKVVVLILVLYVDDTLCAGERKEVQWAYVEN